MQRTPYWLLVPRLWLRSRRAGAAALLLALLLAAGCQEAQAPPPANRETQEEAIYEAVLRYAVAHWDAASPKAYFIAVGGEDADPTPDFLARFADHQPPVRPVSRSSVESGRVLDRQTGEEGVLFHVGAITWVSESEVRVEGGHYEHRQSASGKTYRLMRQGESWSVVQVDVNWVA